jgi:hypothetical protein
MVRSICSLRCLGKSVLPGAATSFLLLIGAQAATAQTCLQNEYNLVNHQNLNCTAGDVKIAQVTNIRDPLTGQTLTSCIAGGKFNFLADFTILTTSSRERENVGLYIANNSTTQALTGTCDDNIISPKHQCPGSPAGIFCGSDNYHQDPAIAAPDNCGDTSSNDVSPLKGNGVEIVTLEIDNFACNPPAGSKTLVLPNCTSWQEPGGNIQCVSNAPNFPYPFNGPGGTPTAIPGAPSKCNCGVIPLAITVQTPGINVFKACTTNDNPGPATFNKVNGVITPDPTACTIHPEGGDVTYTVDMVNDQSNFGDVVIDQICDTAYGNIYTTTDPKYPQPACAAGNTGTISSTNCNSSFDIPFGGSQPCTFTVKQAENVTVINTAKVSGHGLSAGNFVLTPSNSVTVVSNEALTTATVTKGVAATTAACATVRYTVDVKNTSTAGTDETLSLSALNDTAADFGNITSVHDNVLGTTCGVDSSKPGLGTLSASTGGGVLSATVAPGGDYTCKFDAKFCSALDLNGCISHTNSINATLDGDEGGEKVSTSANQITVKECLTTTTTSQ